MKTKTKALMTVSIALVASVVTSHAGITVAMESNLEGCLDWAGTWDCVSDCATTSGTSWTATLQADTLSIMGGFPLLVMRLDGNHNELPIGAATWSAAVALLNAPGQEAQSFGLVWHNDPPAFCSWTFWVEATGPGAIDWSVRADHMPEPTTYAMVTGLGLAGFGLYRRLKI